MRLAVLASHPIQYQAPVFRELARRLDIHVFYAHRASKSDQAEAGFGIGFDWDVDLLSHYMHSFLQNVAPKPGLDHFAGCDTPTVAAELERGKFDAVLAMGWHLKCFWQGIWAAKRAGIPILVRGDSHLETPRSRIKRMGKLFVYPIALRLFDAALYVGERSRQYWEHYGYPKDRLFFSPHCVDNAWFAEHATETARIALRARSGIAPSEKVVLFAGKLIPLKRPLDLIAAASLLAFHGAAPTVLIAGSGALAGTVAEQTRDRNVHVVQLGFCNQTQMPEVYAAADVLALTSGQETWGLVANEALASGVPIIVSDACGCAPDLAGDKLAGLTFPTGNITALANAMKQFIEHPPSRKVIASKAEQYSVSRAVEGVLRAVEVATWSTN